MRRLFLATAFGWAIGAAGVAWAQMPGGMGGMGGGQMPSGRPSSGPPGDEISSTPHEDKPDVAAQKMFKSAEKSLRKAMGYDDAAQKAANPDKRADELDKARDEYYRALDQFTEALSDNAEMVQAWSAVGYIHERLGAYREAIDDYDHVLKYKPDSNDSIERRAEAYMRLDRLDDAKSAYMDLYNHEPKLAAQLMLLMQQWLVNHRADAGGMRASSIDAFDAWVKERKKIAQ